MSSNPYFDLEPRGLTAEALGDRIDALMLGVEGHDSAAVAERARRAADLLRPVSQRRDAADAAAAAAGDPAEPDVPDERFGPSLAAQVGGDLDRLFHDDRFRDRLRDELLHDIEEWGTVLLDDEDGVRYEFIAPTQEGLQEADHQVLQIQRALSDRGAIPEQRTPISEGAGEAHGLIDRLDGVVRQADLTSLDWDVSWHPETGTASMVHIQQLDYDPRDNPWYDPRDASPITDWRVELIAARGSRTISVVLDDRAHDLTDDRAAHFLDVFYYRAAASRGDVVWDALRPHLDRARLLPRLGAEEMDIEDPVIHDDGLTLTLHPSWTGPGAEQSVGLTLPADGDDVAVRAGGSLTDLGRAGELDPAALSPGELGAVTPDLVGIDGPLDITDAQAAALVLGVSETTMNQAITTLSTGLRQARDDLRALDAERRAPDPVAATAETVLTRITRDTPRPDLTIYATPGCTGCEMTRREADRAGLSYETIDLSDRPDRIRDMVAMASSSAPATEPAQGAGGVPQASSAVGDRSRGITR